MRLYIGWFFLFMLIVTESVSAMTHGLVVRGSIYDAEGNPVEAANVTLLNARDSLFISGTSSDRNGKYSIATVRNDSIIVKVSYVGMKTSFFDINSPVENVVTHDFYLKADSRILGETVVTAEAPPVVIIGDTVSYSAAAIPLHEGAVLEDLIKKIPGAELSQDGKITLNGKEITKIMIDGKEFFANNPEIALKNLPADVVKDVKTYDRKSDMARITGIDDDEENNVLDVTIKDGMKKGWFGNFIAGAGSKRKYEGGGMINHFRGDVQISLVGAANNTNGQGYNDISDADIGYGGNGSYGEGSSESVGVNVSVDRKKVEFHTDLSYNHGKQYVYQKDKRETYLTHGSSYETKSNNKDVISNAFRGSLRLVYRPDTLTDIHLNYRTGKSRSRVYNDRSTETFDDMMNPVNFSMSYIDNDNDDFSFDGNLMINRKLGKKGRNITLDFRYGKNTSGTSEHTLSDTYFYFQDSLALINRLTESKGNNFSYHINISYSEPLWKDAHLRLSYRYNSSSSSSEREPVYNLGAWDDSYILSNETYNRNHRHQAEVRLQSKLRLVTFNVSLGLLPTVTRTRVERGINAGLDKRQTSLDYQPSANVVVRIDNRRQVRLSYHGRSSTPSILDLQEVKDISDPMNLQYGNPNLKNTYSQSLILSYSGYNPEKGSNIMMHIMANNTVNGITNRTIYDPETGVRSTQTDNINGNWVSNAMLTFNSPLKNKKFNVGSNLYINYSHRVGYSSMLDSKMESVINISDNANVGSKVFASYRSTGFDCYLSAGFDTGVTRNNLNSQVDRTTHIYSLSANTNINLPWDMFFSTDISLASRHGFSEGYDRNIVMWNAQLSKNFLKNKQATIRFKVYDILQMQSNTFRTVSFDYTQDTETNMVGSYFIVHFVYRLNMMGRSVKRRPPHPKGPDMIRT